MVDNRARWASFFHCGAGKEPEGPSEPLKRHTRAAVGLPAGSKLAVRAAPGLATPTTPTTLAGQPCATLTWIRLPAVLSGQGRGSVQMTTASTRIAELEGPRYATPTSNSGDWSRAVDGAVYP